jgi:tetrapyrrole methylase family protein/MazG family protein
LIAQKADIRTMTEATETQKELQELIALIKKLRAPDGCPWDRKQKPEDIGKYVLDEAYEVIDALETKDPQALKEELGDLLFQILFLAEMGTELNQFSLADIMAGIKEKMIRRHPHVFGDVTVTSVQEVKENWQAIKKKERGHKGNEDGLFATVPRSLPALKRAQKITSVASTYGFDWPKTADIREKLNEELQEFNDAVKSGSKSKIEEELGDVFFTLVNLSRFLSVDAETALSKTTGKFLRRFSYITEQLSAQGIPLTEANLAQMDALWNEAKSRV